MQYLGNAATVIDLVVIASLFVSALGANLALLRVPRTIDGRIPPSRCYAAGLTGGPQCRHQRLPAATRPRR